MYTRVSSSTVYAQALDRLQQRQADMSDAQQRMTSGKRVLEASDDPTAAARAERARAMLQRAEAEQRAVDASRNAMTLSESALGDGVDLLQQARELVVSAGNATYSDAQRRDVAQQLEALRKQLLSIANRSDGAGGTIFGGQGASDPPFIDEPGGVGFRGLGGEVVTASRDALPLTVDGEQAFLYATTGNGSFETVNVGYLDALDASPSASAAPAAWIDGGRVSDANQLPADGFSYTLTFSVSSGVTQYTIDRGTLPPVGPVDYQAGKAIEVDGMSFAISGQPADGNQFLIRDASPALNIFSALDRIVAGLRHTPSSTATVTQTVQKGLGDIDAGIDSLQSARSRCGELLNRIDGVDSRLQDQVLMGENTRSDAEDLDMAQAISDFENQQTGYNAALRTYASVQRMSLFDYLSS
ncbi:flagellar hook-associated protein FlgL [Ideonella livida]|uniref:Flagellar hook-associated protein 3 n=1 Tax=Ideonella livida TaxID=2707176 RepID=A0A7C9TJ34_9BURK|nr:flagellar hook-associated protein FlgL [Ideonella livida]NDY89947.1 flagellar hook-associated protein 3 [Ideonella livida]